MITHILKSAGVYIWFGDYHSFLPVLLAKIWHKKSYIVLGGYDVTYIPELKYGSLGKPLRKWCTLYSLKNATLNLAVSDNIKTDALQVCERAKIDILYTGYSEDKFFHNPQVHKEIILTVGVVGNLQRVKLKGIDFFCLLAKRLPQYNFIIIGISKNAIKYLPELPTNIQCIEKTPPSELLEYYQKAKVYAQFSLREGLPNSVCEAMLCECVPVGLSNGGIPVAIGDCGYLVSNIEEAVNAIKEAMVNSELGKKARERIINTFSIQNRKTNLQKLLDEGLL